MSEYVVGELARALRTATKHEDTATRVRASERVNAWSAVLAGAAAGQLRFGSRLPVRGLPAWVTLEVLRGGFATGRPAASGPLHPYEVRWIDRFGLPRSRAALFAFFLTDAGLAELQRLLADETYRVELPEEGALLTVAWLLGDRDRAAALELLEELLPFIDRLRFAPRRSAVPSLPANHLFLRTAAQVQSQLRSRPESPAVEAQRETLAVWNPLADQFLALWWDTRSLDGVIGARFADEWNDAARGLLDDYDQQARLHNRSSKHRNPKQNLPILVAATRAQLAGVLDARRKGLAQTAVNAMVAKRGEPSSQVLRGLREGQARVAQMPSHREMAHLVARRLDESRPDEGLLDPSSFSHPVTPEESVPSGVPVDQPMPTFVRSTLVRALAAPVETLIDEGVVTSAEVLAALAPTITAATVHDSYPDPRLGSLMAANYVAFRRRRSLLLRDLAKQVQLAELPWVRAVTRHSLHSRPDDTLAVARRVGALAVDHFPGHLVPNRLVKELDQLFTSAGQPQPLVEELAADIFMGRFSNKFLGAAVIAGNLLQGSLYARYYDLDYTLLAGLAADRGWRPRLPWTRRPDEAATFGDLCTRRAGPQGGRWSVARNGKIIEQAQLYTTHNLAVLVQAGVKPRKTWLDLATAAHQRTLSLIELSTHQERPLRTIKDAAYAWRQSLFYLSMTTDDDTQAFLHQARTTTDPPHAQALLAGLEDIHQGQTFDPEGHSRRGRQLLGWTTTKHWLTSTTSTTSPDRA